MRVPQVTTIDFETDPIEPRPAYPPKPVAVSIKEWGRKPVRFSWGYHGHANPDTREQAVRALRSAWKNPDGLLFHHGKFDVDVAETHLGLARPAWDRFHDTLYLAFLRNPHAASFALKPSAEVHLGMPPVERDEVAEWLMRHQPVPGRRITKKSAMAYVAWCDPEVAGRYADGDVIRTEALFRKLWREIVRDGMSRAYDRERRLMAHLLDNEREGVAVDVRRLSEDVDAYSAIESMCTGWVARRLATPGLNVASNVDLVDAMLRAGVATVQSLGQTKKGAVQTNKAAIQSGVTDRTLAAVLQYIAQLGTCLGTFMRPWLTQAGATGGRIHTNWNQVRNSGGDGLVGTRTGRLSSSPNFQNIPKEFREFWERNIVPLMRDRFVKRLPPLPLVRSYVVPFKGEVMIDRDFNQQELRILAHYDPRGTMRERYAANPWLDFHDEARLMINGLLGRSYDRKPIKNTGFMMIYGGGIPALVERNGITVAEAQELKRSYLAAFPGLKDLYDDMRDRARSKEPIRTWGGRLYWCEEPRVVDGRVREFDYKMVNYLIQGSAADCTKEAIVRYCDEKPAGHRLMLQVHDQLSASVPPREVRPAMGRLREAMESVEFDVPLLSEGDASRASWAALEKYDTKGEIVWKGR